MALYYSYRHEGIVRSSASVHVGGEIHADALNAAVVESPGFWVQADGHELEQAIKIATNGLNSKAPVRVMTFVGDEARKILLNWE